VIGMLLAWRRPAPDLSEAIGNTRRDRDQWFALLDEWGAAERPHPEIARWLAEAHGVPLAGPGGTAQPGRSLRAGSVNLGRG
jgi:hypothetical protein